MTAAEIAGLFSELELLLAASLRHSLARHRQQERREGGRGGVPAHWEAWQAAKLRDLARFRRENEALLARYAPVIDTQTRALVLQQAAEGGSNGFFGMDDGRVQALLKELQTAQARTGKAALRFMDDVYRRTVRTAALGMASGTMTLPQAVDRATRDFLANGVRCIQYRDGRRVNIADYAEMALRTAAARAALIGQAARRGQLGIDTVLVSQYGGCSPTCLPWQGLVYIDDVWQAYRGPSNLAIGGSYGRSRNGKSYPLLSVAVKAGLFHPNCRHTLTTWIEGVSRRPAPMDKAKIEAAYRLEQKQRALERAVRAARRQAAGLLDERAAADARARVRTAQARLRGFVAQHGDVLRRDPWREREDGVPAGKKAHLLHGQALHGLNLEPKPVTMESIQRIKPFACSTLDAAGQTRLMRRHKQLLAFAHRLESTHIEAGQVFDLHMEPLTKALSGQAAGGSIRLPDQPAPYIAIHTHPDCNIFSSTDLRRFAKNSNLKLLTALGHDGTIYAVEKLAGYNESEVREIARALDESVKGLDPADENAWDELERLIIAGIEEMTNHGVGFIRCE